ncbi:zinc metalloprotease HtpX [Pseudochelatococcus sp. B33]
MRPSSRHKLNNLAQTALIFAGMTGMTWLIVASVASDSVALAAVAGLAAGLILAPTVPKELLLSAYNARPLTEREFPSGVLMLKELSRRAGHLHTPRLYYIPSAVPNAFALGFRTENAICLTDGILRLLNYRELAGVLAHEVSHIANRDLWIMGLADMMSRLVSLASYVGQLIIFLNLPLLLAGHAVIPWHVPLLLIFSPTIMALLQLALSRTREFDADLGAVELTGDPEGLASALLKLERRVGHFWEDIVLPGRRIPEPSLLRTHPKTADRVARLRRLIPRQPAEWHGGIPDLPGIRPIRNRPRYHRFGTYF